MTRYDDYGWPINPATNKSYTYQEVVADKTLPLPVDVTAIRLVKAARARRAARPRRNNLYGLFRRLRPGWLPWPKG